MSMPLSSLSLGKRASCNCESSSMPAKERIGSGPSVFSGAWVCPGFYKAQEKGATVAYTAPHMVRPSENHPISAE